MAALKADDDAAIVALFGDDYKDLVITPDRAANSATRAKIVAAMQTMRVLDERGADRRVVLIGDQAWPMPIPLVKDEGRMALRDRGRRRRAHQPAHRRQRAQRDRRAARLPRRAAPVRVARPRRRQRAAVRAEARQHARQARRPLLAGGRRQGRGVEPVRAAGRRERGLPQGAQGRRSVPRLPLQDPDAPGQERAGRRVQLRHQRPHDRRLRDGRVSGAVRRERHHDVHREQQRQGLREGPRPQFTTRPAPR